jgi:hypothetical protein
MNRDVNTRRRNDLHVPAQTLALSRSDPHACKANLYSLLPVSLKAERRYSVFQKRLKALVYDQRFLITLNSWCLLMDTFDFVLCFYCFSFSFRLFLDNLLFLFSI